ncbi:dTDP-4-dehydrorhamnose 3,5-epimerase [Pseudohoeflea suaedae]|uniref:dTDP-4-dehydrorhamnose 3,5-epimerase n=1 Tax=Pseudohoeflea suaedae TaxID=877384 RepID=A0A4V3A7G7_9HYPH|nr:dTDP-4-dehydrorhamnose 3,5-epimerase [Pseudohoeflea suaedae]TDH38725.1 dTDP-4-dehydrorhamnose 3,5-epimerase [Pseudohoeflea suaedae]
MPEFKNLGLDGVVEVVPDRFGDDRGFFSETYNARLWKEGGIAVDFVQDNFSLSRDVGTVRGLHFQTPSHAQAKLVRVTRGRVFDVAVDIRKGSPDFGKWVGVELSAEKWNQLFVPAGFAHGFVTLEADTEMAYKVSAFYSKEHDRAIRFDDPELGIDWPLAPGKAVLSSKDAAAGPLSEMETGFVYQADRSE